MIYISKFLFPHIEKEYDFLISLKRTCYDNIYPFQILSKHHLMELNFEPITILYGGNGSGKTTVLNVMAETLKLKRDTLYNRSNFFEDYVRLCDYEALGKIPGNSRIVTSDDVFDYIMNIRAVNEGVDRKREELFEEYLNLKYQKFQMRSLDDYEKLKKINQARSRTQSKFVRENLTDNIREQSNGESAFFYFTEKVEENGLYLLDEPENSLAPDRQEELAEYIYNSARFFGCQFVISTHSPFFLAIPGARIYDMDEEIVDIKKWYELSNVRVYYEFFMKHGDEFL
nr:AAA family ATPase [uncultured Sellimonas sp.]